MLNTDCVDLLFVLTAVKQAAGWCRVLCRQEFKLLLLINKLTGGAAGAAVVSAHHAWQQHILAAIYLLPPNLSCIIAKWFVCSAEKASCMASFCRTSWILYSLFLVKLLLKKNWLILQYYTLFECYCHLKCGHQTQTKFKQIRTNKLLLRETAFCHWDPVYSPTLWLTLQHNII